MRDKYGNEIPSVATNGDNLLAAIRTQWSTPIQAAVDVPFDRFDVTQHHVATQHSDSYEGSSACIYLTNSGKVYVCVQAYDHVSAMRTHEFPWDEFVEKLGTMVDEAKKEKRDG